MHERGLDGAYENGKTRFDELCISRRIFSVAMVMRDEDYCGPDLQNAEVGKVG